MGRYALGKILMPLLECINWLIYRIMETMSSNGFS